MRSLDRKLLRDLWRMRGQAAAIALVIGCGVSVVVMSFGTIQSLRETRDAYYERYRFAHVFAHVKRAPEALARSIARIPGVKQVETRIVEDVTLDIEGMAEPATGRLISVPERGRPVLNDLALMRGRLLTAGRPDEVLISEALATAHRLNPGDHLSATINGHKRKLDIVGVALSPEYVYSIGPGVIVPDDRRFGVLWMGREALAAAFDLDAAFNDVVVSLSRSASSEDVIARLDNALEPFGGVGAYGRDDQLSDSYLSGEMDQLTAIGWVVPPIFLAIAAFMLNVVASRLVETQRDQIGLLKAFGYSDGAIGRHYLVLVLSIAAIGVLVGLAAGAWLGRAITELYTQFFHFPLLHYRPSLGLFAIAALISMAAGALGTLGATRRAILLPPAEAMAPAPPTDYRPSPLERIAPRGAFSQATRMILRHITRWPTRSALTTMGAAMSVALLVSTLFFYDSIDRLIDVYYQHAQRQDVTVTFVEPTPERVLQEVERLPGVMMAEAYRAVSARLRFGHRSRRVSITGLPPGAHLRRMLDIGLRPVQAPAEGLVLSTKLAELLGAGLGDRVTIEILEGRRPVRKVAVAALVEEYIATPAYMDRTALNRLMREGPLVSGANLMVDRREEEALYRALKDTPVVAGVTLLTAAIETFRRTMAETMTIMISFYVIFASIIAIGVVYNSARIALSERGRELASLRVLGFTRHEVSYILLGELAALVLLALPMGCLIGFALAWSMTLSFDTDLYRLPLVVERSTYAYSVLIVILATLGSGLIVALQVNRLNLIAALKTRE